MSDIRLRYLMPSVESSSRSKRRDLSGICNSVAGPRREEILRFAQNDKRGEARATTEIAQYGNYAADCRVLTADCPEWTLPC